MDGNGGTACSIHGTVARVPLAGPWCLQEMAQEKSPREQSCFSKAVSLFLTVPRRRALEAEPGPRRIFSSQGLGGRFLPAPREGVFAGKAKMSCSYIVPNWFPQGFPVGPIGPGFNLQGPGWGTQGRVPFRGQRAGEFFRLENSWKGIPEYSGPKGVAWDLGVPGFKGGLGLPHLGGVFPSLWGGEGSPRGVPQGFFQRAPGDFQPFRGEGPKGNPFALKGPGPRGKDSPWGLGPRGRGFKKPHGFWGPPPGPNWGCWPLGFPKKNRWLAPAL